MRGVWKIGELFPVLRIYMHYYNYIAILTKLATEINKYSTILLLLTTNTG